MKDKQKFVLFPLGKKRFALPAGQVTELARPDSLQPFPHTTPWLAGVLLRRGRIVPVFDVARILFGAKAPSRKFYLIATRLFGKDQEWTAVPVTGECTLLETSPIPPTGSLPKYVIALLSLEDEIVEVLDLDRLAASEAV